MPSVDSVVMHHLLERRYRIDSPSNLLMSSKDFGRFRGLIEKLDAGALNALQEKGSMQIDGVEFAALLGRVAPVRFR